MLVLLKDFLPLSSRFKLEKKIIFWPDEFYDSVTATGRYDVFIGARILKLIIELLKYCVHAFILQC